MTAKDVLTNALKLISSSPAAWTQGALARDKKGNECDPHSPSAVCWCPQGAISRAAGDERELTPIARDYLQRSILPSGAPKSIPMWNDLPGTNHVGVVAAMERAIQAAR